MKMRRIVITFVLAVALFGCGKPQLRHIVILLDVSASIEHESLEQAFRAVHGLASRLHRGDKLTIIPIMGDAQAETSGHIVRFEVPVSRQAYDRDLQNSQRELESSLTVMQMSAREYRGSRTDILGSVALTAQEFLASPGGTKRTVIILSDFIQEDIEINFRTDGRLLSPVASARFSQQLAKSDSFAFRNTAIYLGLLRSDEFANLARTRRAAIKEFWISYFKSLGGTAEFSADGPGLIKRSRECCH